MRVCVCAKPLITIRALNREIGELWLVGANGV